MKGHYHLFSVYAAILRYENQPLLSSEPEVLICPSCLSIAGVVVGAGLWLWLAAPLPHFLAELVFAGKKAGLSETDRLAEAD